VVISGIASKMACQLVVRARNHVVHLPVLPSAKRISTGFSAALKALKYASRIRRSLKAQ
jgi:hypothetical protein